MRAIRFGVLGAARIVPASLLAPAAESNDVEVIAIAARDVQRAQRFAEKHHIANVHGSYESLIVDPDINAIYNPLPNGLHGYWTMAALQAGKAVLCEKPFAANAAEAQAVADVADRTGLVTMEAFHYRYHAVMLRMMEIANSGELGEIERIDAWMHFPLPVADIRWDLDLAGGSLMDAGCYAIHIVRHLADSEPNVKSAKIKQRTSGVDRYALVEFEFPQGFSGSVCVSMLAAKMLGIGAELKGSKGSMRVFNPVLPQLYHRLRVKTTSGSRTEKLSKSPSSYTAQLSAFAEAVLEGKKLPTDAHDAIANMKVIDACYVAAGLSPRQPTKT